MSVNKDRIIFGFILIAIGIGYIGKIFGAWEFTLLFPGYWTMILILPALYTMFHNGISFANIYTLLVGAYFLADANHWLSFRLTFPMIAAIGCISVGVKLLFTRRVTWYDYRCKD